MSEGQVQETTIEDFFALCKKGGKYQIETPDGWQSIGSLVQKNNKECYNLVLENGLELSCSDDHHVWTRDEHGYYAWKKSKDIDVNSDWVLARSVDRSGVMRDMFQHVVAKEHIGVKDTFDLEVLSEEHAYYSNDIVSHNTGKSMSCDALASEYKMPLLRLDFGAVFSSHVGESEANIRQCLQTAESIAPCIIGSSELFVGGFDLGETVLGLVPIQTIWTAAKWLSVSSDYGKLIESDDASQLTFDPPLQILGYDLSNNQPQWTYMHSLVRKKSVARLRITMDDGNTLEVTKDHKLLVSNRGKNAWKKAKDLKEGDSIITVNNSDIQAVVAEDNTNDRENLCLWKEVSGCTIQKSHCSMV